MSGTVECPTCGAPSTTPARPGAQLKCRYCKASFQVPSAAGGGGGGGDAPVGNSEAPLPQKGRDPLGGLVTKGIWQSIRDGHALVYLSNRDRLLDWEPSSGRYHVWQYDRTIASGDPLPRGVANGTWSSIGGGHELISLGGDQVLDWEPATGAYRVWQYDPNAHGERDVFPQLLSKGTWSSIAASKRLFPLGQDRVLDWEPSSGAFRIWQYDRRAGSGDPLPGGPVCEGSWSSIREGHELVYLGNDRVLDWVPASGNYRLWSYDRSARGGGDPFPRELAAGNWASIRSGHELISLEQNRVLDWEPDSGAYRIWAVEG
ncbi:MAG: hypothetical protein IPM79_12235 [Polyangiaceae bacterium]|jgi:hypothetical protein|nr:hypothetical protein [Polyangiaceae bacterium]MBK8938380.1 hypothetical protein [Polyangiaceae bacterium]